ncbi:MAG: PDZ domain-containing protein [Clostridiales bacterium]|nr:PDZ domain-containing protein [Clostridiales bacterium]
MLIVDTGEIISPSGTAQEPAKNIVEAGDYILAFNEKEVSTKKELMEDLSELDGEEVTLAVRRGSEVLNLSITPVQDAGGNYRLGIWVRDDTQGIGTLTFVTMDGQFGALGHGISDVDTAQLLAVREGSLYGSTILGIRKGSSGNPGELSGLIRYESANCLGTITGNTELGIFGMLDLDSMSALSLTELPLGCKQEMETGEASILCDVDGQVEEYEVEITRIDMGSADTNKSFVLTVTDEELLEKTGGIIQGMSGSPVIQNGKFVGAVTHVFVQDATSGYGIFAETMLEQLEEKNGGDSVEEGKNVA